MKQYQINYVLHIAKEDIIQADSKDEAMKILMDDCSIWEEGRTLETEIDNIDIIEVD